MTHTPAAVQCWDLYIEAIAFAPNREQQHSFRLRHRSDFSPQCPACCRNSEARFPTVTKDRSSLYHPNHPICLFCRSKAPFFHKHSLQLALTPWGLLLSRWHKTKNTKLTCNCSAMALRSRSQLSLASICDRTSLRAAARAASRPASLVFTA